MGSSLSKGFGKTAKAPNLRDKLSAGVSCSAFDADFQEHGVDVIQQLRAKDPVRYAELAGRLITAAQDPTDPNDYSNCQTEEEIVRKLLLQVGMTEDQLTPASAGTSRRRLMRNSSPDCWSSARAIDHGNAPAIAARTIGQALYANAGTLALLLRNCLRLISMTCISPATNKPTLPQISASDIHN